MSAMAEHLDFSPPQQQRWGHPLLLALLVHGLLVAALTWGVGWQRDSAPVVMEAELWSRLPQTAAPRAVAPEPEPPPPEPKPEPAPEPASQYKPVAPPGPTEAEIALQQQQAAEQRREAQLEKQRREAEAKRQAEEARRREAERLAEQRRQREVQERRRQEAARQAEAARRQAELEAQRQKNLERMMGQAGATGAPGSTGTAQRSSGPSASYAGQVVGRIRPNIVFPDVIAGNPRAEVEVRTLPDGTILGRRLTQPSGNAAWDDAVLRAIDRTARLPKDENGRVPPTLILGFRPQD